MQSIRLEKISRVYRFGIREEQWVRENAVADHFIAYKLHGFTLHEHNGKKLPFTRDMIMVANSEDLYRVTKHDPQGDGIRGGCIAIHFLTEGPFPLHLSIFDCAHQPQLRSEFFRMLDQWNQYQSGKNPAAEYACIACFYTILSHLMAMMTQSPVDNDHLAAAKEYIDRNYANASLSVADAAACTALGQRRFGELFQERYHQTPGKYLTARRIEASVELLKQDRLSISEIASLTGFSSASYFIRVFRQQMGLSPHAYRQQAE